MTTPQWTADIEIDAALAKRTIAEQFPALRVRDVVRFGNGWDNVAFLADGATLFRFPRRRICAELLEREAAVLPAIVQSVPLRISAPTHVGRPTQWFPWPFAGYELIAGSTACDSTLDDDGRTALALPLAKFLRALHAIDPQPSLRRGLDLDRIGRLDSLKGLAASRERVATLSEHGASPSLDTCAAWLEDYAPGPAAHVRRTIVHGDLYARHVVLDERARIAGIIDWGDVHYGDPAIDIAIAHLMLPATAHAAFRGAYGSIDPATWELARFRAIYHAMLELDYGTRVDDAGMRRIGSDALRLIATALEAPV